MISLRKLWFNIKNKTIYKWFGRRVFYIEVGNLQPDDIVKYMNEVKDKIKKNPPMVDPKTGQINLKYDIKFNNEDFFIPTN